ncbi:hypothetical protein PN836_020075 [Ningiella sp. W23]|uniref:hypothetical protein n=1 Tax=Ningiella sp. W23 TaxID=3023715 RepID=UPI003757EAD6
MTDRLVQITVTLDQPYDNSGDAVSLLGLREVSIWTNLQVAMVNHWLIWLYFSILNN